MNHRITQIACSIARPLLRRLPAGRVLLLGWIGGGQDSIAWSDAIRPIRIWWDSDLQAYVETDVRDWVGRWHYFSGRHYDQIVPSIMKKVLRGGDMFIDVGANIGLHSVRASRLVGPLGSVHAVEPDPSALPRLQLHLQMNRIRNVILHPCAVGSGRGHAILRVDSDHSGTATLRKDPSVVGNEVEVDIRRLDELINVPSGESRSLVKIDVEGFELEAMMGASKILESPNTVFLVEITPRWIEVSGGDADDLFNVFRKAGYRAFRLSRRRLWYREEADLTEVQSPILNQADYLFLRDYQLRWLQPSVLRIKN